ncbi:MAG: glycosyltransferase [Lachnospiraceae bacterium]|jgi:glycosyltransferase involved in cell wall biosynthesis|nr:glycosyltransferase [Lachnospiraceae bacterium]
MSETLRISQCMIVKNEEKNIERALSWGRDIMWEQIVVDTGSTDRTVELAQKMGAKVFHFTWIDDFAAAKNYALEKAQGDWIAFLDADEYMEPDDVKKVYALLSDFQKAAKPYLAVFTACINLHKEGRVVSNTNQLRFFRNHADLRYAGRIHERLVKGDGTLDSSELFDAWSHLRIYHTGYTEEAYEETGKLKRNLDLIMKELEEHPDDYKMMGNLADVYRAMGESELAIRWYEKAIESLPPVRRRSEAPIMRTTWSFVYLLYLLYEQKKGIGRALSVYEKAVQYIPQECDFDYIMGKYYIDLKDWERAIYHLERGLDLYRTDKSVYYGMLLSPNLMSASEYLAICCYNAGKRDKCVHVSVTFLMTERFAMGILKVLLMAFAAEARALPVKTGAQGDSIQTQAAFAGQVLTVLGQLYDFTALKDRLFVLKAANEVQYGELAQVLQGLFSPEEQMLLSKMR